VWEAEVHTFYVRFDILTSMKILTVVLWIVAPGSSVGGYQHIREHTFPIFRLP
jgi:hypothetical protein